MTFKTLLTTAAAAAVLAGPALAAAQTTQPSNGKVQREESRQGRAAQTNPNNTQGRTNANENAGFGAGAGDTGGQKGGQTGGLRQGMSVVDAAGNVIGTIVRVQETREGDVRSVTVRFDQFGRVMLKLVPKIQLKVQGTRALTDLVREQVEQLQDAPA